MQQLCNSFVVKKITNGPVVKLDIIKVYETLVSSSNLDRTAKANKNYILNLIIKFEIILLYLRLIFFYFKIYFVNLKLITK